MQDTNLIKVENIKAAILKIKDWVSNLYPMTYDKNVPKLKVSNTKSASSREMLSISGNSSTNLKVECDELKLGNPSRNYATATDDFKLKYNANDVLQMEAKVRAINPKKTYMGNSNSEIILDSTEESVEFNSGEEIKFKATKNNESTLTIKDDNNGGGSVTLRDSSATKHNRLFVGIDPSEIPSPAQNRIYLGSKSPLGHAYMGQATNVAVSSGTSAYTDLKSLDITDRGVYYVQWSAYSTDLLGDKVRFAGGVALNGSTIPNSRMAIVTSVSTRPSIGGGAVVELGESETTVTVSVRVYQDSGSKKNFDGYIRYIKIA